MLTIRYTDPTTGQSVTAQAASVSIDHPETGGVLYVDRFNFGGLADAAMDQDDDGSIFDDEDDYVEEDFSDSEEVDYADEGTSSVVVLLEDDDFLDEDDE